MTVPKNNLVMVIKKVFWSLKQYYSYFDSTKNEYMENVGGVSIVTKGKGIAYSL